MQKTRSKPTDFKDRNTSLYGEFHSTVIIEINLKLSALGIGIGYLSLKGSGREYFRLCGPSNLGDNYSAAEA